MKTKGLAIVVIMLSGSSNALGAEQGTVTEALAPETRAILVREMRAIDAAMSRIHTALVTGDHPTVAGQAQAIHDSFVLAQELSDQQRAQIRELPSGFVAADRAFHQLAQRLADAGEARDSRAQRVWFEEMTRACLACHEEFAAGRFPGLSPTAPTTP